MYLIYQIYQMLKVFRESFCSEKSPQYRNLLLQECSRATEESLENLLCAIDERRIMDLLRAFHQMYSVRSLFFLTTQCARYRLTQRIDMRDLSLCRPEIGLQAGSNGKEQRVL